MRRMSIKSEWRMRRICMGEIEGETPWPLATGNRHLLNASPASASVYFRVIQFLSETCYVVTSKVIPI